MTTQVSVQSTFAPRQKSHDKANLPLQIWLATWRSLTTIFRTPVALFPPLAISIFFLVIYESTLGGAAAFIPNLSGNSYLGFIFARGQTPEQVETALRLAHSKLHFEIVPELALVLG